MLRSVAELGSISLGFGRMPQMGVALVAPESPLVLGLCLVIHTHSSDIKFQGGMSHKEPSRSPGTILSPSLFAEVSLDGYVHGAQSTGKRDRTWTGMETRPARQDQRNWLGQLSQTVVILVCPFLPPPRHSLPTDLGKGRKFPIIATRQLLPFLECLLCASHCMKSLHGSL